MPILNYSTKIDAWKTCNEVQQILSKHGVSHFSIKNEGGFPVALSFTVEYKGTPLNFLLPCNYQGVLSCFKKDKKIPSSSKNIEQALRTSWRIVKDWTSSQLALIESEQATVEQIFLPYLVVNSTGETLSEKMLQGNGLKLLEDKKYRHEVV